MYKFILGLIILFCAAACGPSYIYQSEKNIPDGQWQYRDSISFDFNIQDTAKLYTIYLDLATQQSFGAENLYVQLHTILPNGQRLRKVRSFNIFDRQGKIMGTASGEKAKQHVLLQENTYFNQPGAYRIIVEQYMRQDSLAGIDAIGLAVEMQKEKK